MPTLATAPIPALVPDLPAFLEERAPTAETATAVEAARPAVSHRGVCVCLLPSERDAALLALAGGEPAGELHLTLVMCGKIADQPPEFVPALFAAMALLAQRTPRMSAALTGLTRFENVGTTPDPTDPSGVRTLSEDAIVLAVSNPVLDAFRADVHAAVRDLGGAPSDKYGFNPHITLRYCAAGAPSGIERVPSPSVLFDRIAVWAGNTRASYALQEPHRAAEDSMNATPAHPASTTARDLSTALESAAPLRHAGEQLPTVALSAATPEALAPSTAPALVADDTAPLAAVTAPTAPAGTESAPVALRGRVVPFDAGPEGSSAVGEHSDWNAAHALGRLRAWASSNGTGDYETLDEALLSSAFTWWEPESASRKNLNAFKLPHHDIVNGKLVVSRPGLRAAARALMGGDSGIPAEDVEAAKMHLAQHFAQIGEDAPWTARHAPPTELGGGLAVKLTAPAAGSTVPGVVSESWIQVARVGAFAGHSSGGFEFDSDVFDRIIENFLSTVNRRVPVDYEHATELLNDSTLQNGAPAVGWIVELANRGDAGLWGRVQWVDPTAVDYIRTGRYRYFSPAVAFNAIDPVTAQPVGPMLVSGGLTNRPFLDGMSPVTARTPAHATATATARSAEPFTGPGAAFLARVKAEATQLAASSITGERLTPEEARVYRFAAALVLDPAEAERWTSTVIATRVCSAPGPAALRAVPFEDLPLGKAEAWNGGAAVARVLAWATDADGAVNYADVGRAFAWVDPDNAETVNSFKLPHHDIDGGALVTVRRGVEAAMAALNGARGGVDIPAEDRAKVYKHLAGHYALWGAEPPPFVEEEPTRMSTAGSTVTGNARPDTSSDVQVANPTETAPAEGAGAPPAGVVTISRSERMARALSDAWQSPAALVTGLRALDSVWIEGAEEAEELANILRWHLGLARSTSFADVLAQIERLDAYVRGDMGVSDGVPVRDIICSLRGMMNLPVLTTALEVVTAVLSMLRRHPALAPATAAAEDLAANLSAGAASAAVTASIGPEDVHIPGAMQTLTSTSEIDDMDLTKLSALLGLAPTATLSDIEAATSARIEGEKQLRAEHTALTKLHAETTVDSLVASGRLSAAGRDAAVKLSMRDPDGAAALFSTLPVPAKFELSATETTPAAGTQTRAAAPTAPAVTAVNREGAAAMSAQNGAAAPAHAPASVATDAAPPVDRSSAVYNKAVSMMNADKSLTLRAALERADREIPAR